MDPLLEEHEKLEQKGNLGKSIEDVQNIIDLLTKARNNIASGQGNPAMTLAKLQNPVKQSFEKVNGDLKEIHSALNRYSRALDKKFKDKPLPTAENDALSSHSTLINRAIAMHLLREGQFSVAATFIDEAKTHAESRSLNTADTMMDEVWEKDLSASTFNSEQLQQKFAEMYHILHELRQRRNLTPAISWAREHSAVLEHRGSNLEFELCRLHFVCLFMEDEPTPGNPTIRTGPLRAWAYARSEFGSFQHRYPREVQQLLGAMAFYQNVQDSPYKHIFYNTTAWEEVAASFTREFCSLLGLSADSPLYIATTAGAIALPTLLKLQKVMKEKRTEWTTQNELPVEIPLPPSYHFHSIFVCPVSKEQGTDQNPPMMMPCGHVIAKESLDRISKGARFKCPYCPGESHPRDAQKVFL